MSELKREELTIIKRNPQGKETWRYSGAVLRRAQNGLLIEAFFHREDIPFHGILLGRGDRFVEAFFTNQWYNIFEMHDRATDALKGWYCNITRPAEFENGRIDYVDLGLDLLVYPDGRTLVLDEDEFETLDISQEERRRSLAALDDLQEVFRQHAGLLLENFFAILAARQERTLSED